MENKILVVDDEDYHRAVMQKLLVKLGYDVAVVESAEAAFSHLAKEKVSIIMLEMDGVEFCQEIRETDDKTIVIALTGHTDLYEAEKLKEVGFDNHLNKPFKIDVIKEAIQEGFEEFRRRTELQDKTS